MTIPIERDLTQAERFVYGECSVCKAPHGEPCHAEIGAHIGTKVNGERLKTGEGVHMRRLQDAPFRVREVKVR